jgi:hypothetical protein
MNLRHQIALALRHRPLVLPLLLATLCVDLVLAADTLWTRNEVDAWYWGFVLPQIGLLALWLAAGGRRWALRFLVGAGAIAFASIAFSIVNDEQGHVGLATLLAVYYGAVFLLAFFGRAIFKQFKVPRFTTWQLLVVMTLTAPLAAMLRFANWPLTLGEVPILLALIALPLLASACMTMLPSAWMAWLGMLMVGGALELTFGREANLSGRFLMSAVFYCCWLSALKFEPDARRRLAARRRRRAPRLRVIDESTAAQPDIGTPPATPSSLDVTG